MTFFSSETIQGIFGLFDHLPNTYFYIKDRQRKFLWMNQQLRELLGEKEPTGFLGKADFDYFSPDLVFLYHREDDIVITKGKPLLNQPWLVPGKNEKQKWFISSKFPLQDEQGNVFAIAGLMRNLSIEYESSHPLHDLKNVVDYIFAHYSEKISVQTLAALVYLSPRQFERRFYGLFQVSPSDFILKVRLDTAVRMLLGGEESITEVAIRCGFYDNSYFTRQFKRILGMSPIQFRKKYTEQNKGSE